jgi:hypothetical protein
MSNQFGCSLQALFKAFHDVGHAVIHYYVSVLVLSPLLVVWVGAGEHG